MTVFTLDPLTDSRWPEFVARHPASSIFHSREWLKALRLTYAYRPVAFTTSTGDRLSNAIVFCQIDSWLTGKRLVSLPFSDHCQPLAVGVDLEAILRYLDDLLGKGRLRYVELRPAITDSMADVKTNFVPSEVFNFQKIDLRPDLNTIYRAFHDSCIRRKIKRAERETLTYEAGRCQRLQQQFRQLLLLTRRRHMLPPQPAAWFQNLALCLGESMTIHMVSKGTTPIASILTLKDRNLLVYKYGCSDARFSNLGGTPFLFWKAIQQAKALGATELDLGRSGFGDPGLIAFKHHLGGISSNLQYFRNPTSTSSPEASTAKHLVWPRRVLSYLPDSLLVGTGQVFYRHLG